MKAAVRAALALVTVCAGALSAVLLAARGLDYSQVIACRREATPSSFRVVDQSQRGWYLVDVGRGLISPERINSFPYPYLLLSPDFAIGVTEGIEEETMQTALFLHRNHPTRLPKRDTLLTGGSSQATFLAWGPQSKRVTYNQLDRDGRDGQDGMYTVDVQTQAVTRLTEKVVLDMLWSPDGEAVIYHTDFASGYWLLDVTTGERTSAGAYVGPLLAWSPDGALVVTRGERQRTGINGNHLVMLEVESGERWTVRVPASPAMQAVWLSAERLVYGTVNGGLYQLAVRGGQVRQMGRVGCADIAGWPQREVRVLCKADVTLPETC